MAQETCSSSSSSNQAWSYDVFVSFHGKDTRYKFTDHLFAALDRSRIHSFEDNRKLERGKDIWTELEKAIQKSRIAVIVFSENYADSRWCLEELGKIMECERNLQQIVLPVFYEVDPSHLRNQKGSLEKAFVSHEKRFGVGKVDRWRAALAEAAKLSGWVSQAHRSESKFIEEIIEYIVSKLNDTTQLTVAPYPVGIESRVQELNKLLSSSSSEVCMVGIWGIGGVGKTTIAKAIYNQLLQRNFDGSCFLANVGGDSKHPKGLIHLQEKILSSIHASDNRKITLVDQGTTVLKDRAWCKRVLLVLDNVDHQDQLDKLAIRRSYFQPGSIIIITTRDKSMLKLAKVDESKIYTPPTLDYHESIKLFSWHAFEKDHPNEDYAELSEQVIGYAGGLPLVLEVLGSNLSYKNIDDWEVILKTLKVIPDKEIQEKLMVSFYSLSDTQRELFLDLACFFVGMEKEYAFKILQGSYSGLKSDLGVLVHQCLVAIDCSNRLTMHDMIRDMGREVARRERSRLWNHEDVLDVLEDYKVRKLVKGIMLNCPGHDLQVDAKAFSKMHQLRVLQLNYARLKGNFQCPSRKLRYLEWYGFPMESIPADLYLENLVALYMPYSSLIELWTGTKILKKLKFLDVSHSYHLRRTPDFSGIDNLESLLLNNCTNLVEVHESVIDLSKLVTLDLKDCKNLRKIPLGIYNFESPVDLSGCTKLDMVPSFGFKLPLTTSTCYSFRISSEVPLGSVGFIRKLLTRCISSEVPLESVCFNKKLFPQKDFTKGGVQGKRRHLESAVTHHPFHSQPQELIRPNLEYCDNLYQVPELQPGSKMRQIILQVPHEAGFPLPAGIDISKGLPPPVNDNVKMDASLPSSSTSRVHYRASASSSASSSDRVPLLMDDAEDKKWPEAVERHFIDILLEEDAKGNMLQGQFKQGTWTAVVNEFNKRASKSYTKAQLTQKYQRLKQRHRTFSQLIARTRMGWDPISNTVTATEDAWAAAFAVNHRFKEFKRKGMRHYELLGTLFNSNTATGFLQMSSAQPAPNSDEERELDAAFLSEGVHVNVSIDGLDDVEELPTSSEAQSRRQAEKRPAEPSHSSGKGRKGHSLESMTEAIWGFTDMRNRRGKKSINTGDSAVGAASESVTAAVTLLNQHTDVDHVTYCKVVQELHNAKSRAAFFAMTVDRRRAWIEFIGGGLQ